MLSRAAASLYWLGRYIERAEFTSHLVEATLRLDAVSDVETGRAAWTDALEVLGLEKGYAKTGAKIEQRAVTRFLTVDASHPGSVVRCLDAARDNAKAVRTALSRDAWSAINRAWLLFRGTDSLADDREALDLVERAEIETRAFEGSIGRMLRNPSSLFLRLGATIERGDNTARLLDATIRRIPEDAFEVAGIADRDGWQMVLQTVSAINAYRWLYRGGLKPGSVVELLTLRRELPRSLAASSEEAVQHLNALGKFTGLQGEADRSARHRHVGLSDDRIGALLERGLHEFLTECLARNAELNRAISRQFRFH